MLTADPSTVATGSPLIDTVLSVGAIAAAVAGPLIAWYIAARKRPLDQATEKKINQQVTLLGTTIEARRMKRLMRLEMYIDLDIPYHREVNMLLQSAMDAGCIPKHSLPTPPRLPDIDVDDETIDDADSS
jgi:hypothetical protein